MKLNVAFHNCFVNAPSEFAVHLLFRFLNSQFFLGTVEPVWPAGESLQFHSSASFSDATLAPSLACGMTRR